MAASHGVYRPGGTALNAGQVGSTRAAQYIAARCQGEAPDCFDTAAASALKEMSELANSCTAETGNVRTLWKQASAAMSRCGAAIRDEEQIREYCKVVQTQLKNFHTIVRVSNRGELAMAYRLRDMLLSQQAYLTAMWITEHMVEKVGAVRFTPTGKMEQSHLHIFQIRLRSRWIKTNNR